MSWYKCKFCGRETSDHIEICRGCGAPLDHKHTVLDNSYFGGVVAGISSVWLASVTTTGCLTTNNDTNIIYSYPYESMTLR